MHLEPRMDAGFNVPGSPGGICGSIVAWEESMEIIARIYNDLPEKFALPRQSGMAPDFISKIVMEEPFRVREAFRGLELFDHLWLLWEFEGRGEFSPTVRPPRLGGNERMGVFATRSPNRPNRIGMTVVKLLKLEFTGEGPVLTVGGADMKSGTPIYDIKPYLPYADSVPDARCDLPATQERLRVVWSCAKGGFSEEKVRVHTELVPLDPRPRYQKDPDRIYGMSYGGYEISFRVRGDELEITGIEEKMPPAH